MHESAALTVRNFLVGDLALSATRRINHKFVQQNGWHRLIQENEQTCKKLSPKIKKFLVIYENGWVCKC